MSATYENRVSKNIFEKKKVRTKAAYSLLDSRVAGMWMCVIYTDKFDVILTVHRR